jgi:hypothetical protein
MRIDIRFKLEQEFKAKWYEYNSAKVLLLLQFRFTTIL